MVGAEVFDGLRVLGRAVLDVLGFVEDDRVVLGGPMAVEVPPDEGVAGDDQVRASDRIELAVPIRPVKPDHLQVRYEACRFSGPVVDE